MTNPQAHRAKRHKALGIGAVDDLMLVEDVLLGQ